MLEGTSGTPKPIQFTPEKFTPNAKEVERMVQAFLFSQNFTIKNQSSMIKSFDSNSSQKQILQGEIQLLMLIIKHLKHLYSRKQLENKNLEKHLQHFKKIYHGRNQFQKGELINPRCPQNQTSREFIAKVTSKKQENNPTYFQSIQSSLSYFQEDPKTVKSIRTREVKLNKQDQTLVLENKQLRECLEERDQKISDLALKNDKLQATFKKLYQQLKILAKEKEQLFIDRNILSIKSQNIKKELQFQIEILKNQKDTFEANIKQLLSQLKQQRIQADYKEECQFLRNLFQKELDNNCNLIICRIKLMRKIKHLQRIIKAKQNPIKSNQNLQQTNLCLQDRKKLKFNQEETQQKLLQKQTKHNFSQQSNGQTFKKGPLSYLIVQGKEKHNQQDSELQILLNKFNVQTQQQNNDASSKVQFLLQKLTECSIKLQELTVMVQMTKNQNDRLKQQIRAIQVQKNEQIKQIKTFFQNQLSTAKKNASINRNSLIQQSPEAIKNKSKSEKDQVQQTFKRVKIYQGYDPLNKILLQSVYQKIQENYKLTQKIKELEINTKKMRQKQQNLVQQKLNSITESGLKKMILNERKQVTIRYQNPHQQIHQHQSVKIQSNQSQMRLNSRKSINLQNNNTGLSYNPFILDNFNIFRCKLTQFYQNVIQQLQNWQNVQLAQTNHFPLPQLINIQERNQHFIQQSKQYQDKQLKSRQEIDKSFNFQEAMETILMQKMQQFQLFSNSLYKVKQTKGSDNILQQLKSCKSQYESQIQGSQEKQIDVSQINQNIVKDHDLKEKGRRKQLQNFRKDQVESEKKEKVMNYLSQFGFVESSHKLKQN